MSSPSEKPRLGVGFCCLLRPDDQPSPGAIEFLIAAIGSFSVHVYPMTPGNSGDASKLQSRVFRALLDYFGHPDVDHPEPGRVAVQALDEMTFHAARVDDCALRIEDGVISHAAGEPWPQVADLAERIGLRLGKEP